MTVPSDVPSTVLITGAAGFIGFHLARYYQRAGWRVVGADRESFPAGDIRCARMDILRREGVVMELGDLASPSVAGEIFARYKPRLVFHMAARAGVRCRDAAQIGENNTATVLHMLAAARRHPPAHFLFASSSSVYGENSPRPFSETVAICMPENLYAASKVVGEINARFCAMCGYFPVTSARFFNVYGPWGRPDMAPFRFTDCLASGREVPIISGDTRRAWLYIDDAVDACVALAKIPPVNDGIHRIVNIAGPNLIRTMDMLQIIAREMNEKPNIVFNSPEFPEVTSNPADLSLLKLLIGFTPPTAFEDGIKAFLEWYKQNEFLNAVNGVREK